MTTLLLTFPVRVLTYFGLGSKMKHSFKYLAASNFISYKCVEEIWRVRFGKWGYLPSLSSIKMPMVFWCESFRTLIDTQRADAEAGQTFSRSDEMKNLVEREVCMYDPPTFQNERSARGEATASMSFAFCFLQSTSSSAFNSPLSSLQWLHPS